MTYPAVARPAVNLPHARFVTIGLALAAVFVACVALPLFTYTTTIALFGLAHVLSELRWVDHQFGARVRGRLAAWLAGPLLLAVGARLAGMAGWLSREESVTLELLAVAALMVAVVLLVRRRRWLSGMLAAVLAAGAVAAPIHALLLLAVLHNLTPLAFLAQALAGTQRARALIVGGLLFVAVPLLIATGLPFAALSAAGLTAPEASLFAGGGLWTNMGAFVPEDWRAETWALHAFSGAVFAQCMHYATVILVLPRLIPSGAVAPTALLRWPSAKAFAAAAAGASLLAVILYVADYSLARNAYAVVALIHAWIEIPILALAASGTLPREEVA